MNRCVITREILRGREYLIQALFDESGKMTEVFPELAGAGSILGNIYIGRVEKVQKNLNAAFIRIAPGQNCYLPLKDLAHPVFTRKQSAKKEIVQGDELLVQVIREAVGTKDPTVTTNLSFSGTYAVLTTGKRKLCVSAKLSKEEREHYRRMLPESGDTDYGIIIRTNAASVPDETVLAEIGELEARCRKLIAEAGHRTCHSLLHRELPFCVRYAMDQKQKYLSEIVTDDRSVFEELCAAYHISPDRLMTGGSVSVPVTEIETEAGPRLRHYPDEKISLSALYSIKHGIEEALRERVWLKSGACLVIQPTEALTVIDVNSGKNVTKGEAQETYRRVNLQAAREIARQLRLRNISGIVIVDFISLASREAEAELLALLKQEFREDPVPVQVVDMTRLGLVELTRKKERKPLREAVLC